MKSGTLLAVIALLSIPQPVIAQVSIVAPFHPDGIVVSRVGSSAEVLSGTGNPVYLDEYDPGGSLVQSIPLPTTASGGNRRLVTAGNATSEGVLSRSADGRYLVISGYDASAPYPYQIAATAGTTVRRTIARIDREGNVDTTTALTDFAGTGSPRSVVSTDGSGFWMVGSKAGVRYAPFGGSTSIQLNNDAPDPSHLGLFGGWLYLSGDGASPRIASVGTNLPTTPEQALNGLPGLPEEGSPDGFFLADLSASVFGFDTLYVADDTIGLRKFSMVNGFWVVNGTIGLDTDDYRNLTAKVTNQGVVLYSIRKALGVAGGGELVRLIDSGGYNGAFIATPEVLATAPAGTAFRGVALAPSFLPDLTVGVAAPTHATTGEPFDYTITVRNDGIAEATGVTVSFSVPAGLVVQDGIDADGFTGPGPAGSVAQVEFTNGTLGPGATATLVLTCYAATDGTYQTDPGSTSVDPDGLIAEGNEDNNGSIDATRTVIAADAPVPTVFTWNDGPSGVWSDTTKWSNELNDGSAPSFAGRSNYVLNFNASQSYYAGCDLASGFNLNRLNFSGSNSIDISGAVIEFTADGAKLPAITQSGTVETRVSALIGTTDDLTVAVNGAGPLTLSSGIFGDGALHKTGPGKLLLTMPSSYAGATIIEGGTLALSDNGGPNRNAIQDGSFERPKFGAEGWAYTPGFTGWTMIGNSGVASRYSAWVDETPEGAQVAFLQGEPSSISQTVTIITPGKYTLKFRGANRPGYTANGVKFKIEGNEVTSWDNSQFDTSGFFVEKSQSVNLAAGPYTIELAGWNTAGGDVATVIDSVSLTGPDGALPYGSTVGLTNAGATLDIGSSEVTLANLSGVAGSSIINNGLLVLNNSGFSNFGGVISGTGGLVKDNDGSFTLEGNNTYTGATSVSRGLLVLNAPTLSDTAGVSISVNGTLELNFVGTDIVSSLNIDETNYPPGVYDASNLPGRISGTGSIEVVPVAPAPDIAMETAAGSDIASGGSQDFGILEIGTPGDDTKVFSVRNKGSSDLVIDPFSLGIIGANSSDFELSWSGFIDNFYDITLPPGERGFFVIRFTPGGPGQRTAQFSIPSNDPDENPFTLDLTGGAPELPVFTIQPDGFTIAHNSAVAWNVAASGVPAPDYQWYVGESGDTSNPVLGATSAHYQTPVLSTNTSYWVRATNASGSADSNTAFITVNPPSQADIIVSEAVDSVFNPLTSGDTLDFGNGTLGSLIQPKAINVGNLGIDTLEVRQVVITGPDAADFGVDLTGFPSAIGSGLSEFFSVYLVPGTEGPRTATLTIYSNDEDESAFTLTLTGNGTVPAPIVTTSPATGITDTTATLHGSVNPNGSTTTAVIEYGTSTTYGATVPVSLSPGNDNNAQDIAVFLSGLIKGQTYHFRVVASNAWGTSYGADQSFVARSSTNDFTYTISDNQVTITGYTGPGGSVVIPAIIQGLPVVSIGSGAFSSNTAITSVVIPEGVYSISPNAFTYCTALTSVTIPATVNFIGSAAFRGCSAVTSLFIPQSVTYIDLFAFDFMTSLPGFTVDADNPVYSSLDGVLFNKNQTILQVYPAGKTGSYTVPGTVSQIREYAFYFCSNLTGITLPEGLLSIGYGSFEQCDGLTSITIPSTVSQIQPGSISDCNNLTAITVAEPNPSFTSLDGVLFNEDLTVLVQYPAGKSGNYTVPPSVTAILGVAFINADGLTGVTLPAGLTSLGSGAFYSCGALQYVNIPGGVTVIGPTTFTYCSSLSSVTLSEGLLEIGSSAFEGCFSLTGIVIPSTVTNIGNQAFMICTSLTNAIFYGEAPAMGLNVFQYAGPGFFVGYFETHGTGFTAPTWPGYPVTNLGVPAPLIRVSAGGPDLQSGGKLVFGNVTAGILPGETRTLTLRNAGHAPLSGFGFTVDGANPSDFAVNATSLPGTLSPGASGQISVTFAPNATGARLATLIIESNDPAEASFSVDLSGTGTSNLPFTYRIESGEVYITGYIGPDGAVVVPSAIAGKPVVGIDEAAFNGRSDLASLILPDGLRIIGPSAFGGCSALTTFTIPTSVTYIGSNAFSGCNNITQLDIPASVTTVEIGAFNFMAGLTQFTVDPLNTNYSTIGGVLFDFGQTVLLQYPGGRSGHYSLPAGVTRIERSAFGNAVGLTGITFTDDLIHIGAYSFGNTGLTTVVIPASVTFIGAGAFSNCASLTSIDVVPLNGDFEAVGGILFNENQSTLVQYPAGKLDASYTVPTSVTAISESSFFGDRNLTSVVMQPGLLTIGSFAFYECHDLEGVVIPASVTQINIQTFAYCHALETVILSEGLLDLGPYAFQSCSSLVNITIPGSVTTIQYNAFLGCGLLQTATFLGNAPAMGEGVFDATDELFYVGYYDPFKAGFLAPTWPGYTAINLGASPAANNANLASLRVSVGSVTPAFAPGVTSYSVSVSASTSEVRLTPATVNPMAAVRISGKLLAYGVASAPIPLAAGNNSITVEVTAADGVTKKIYTVIVSRAASTSVATNPAETGTARTALLKGTVTPNGIATVYFEYGESGKFDNVTPSQVFQGTAVQAFSATLSGLPYGTAYQFRAVAVGTFGTIRGDVETFTTLQEPPVAATGDPYAVSGSAATLVGAVDPRGLPTDVYFEYGLTTLYGKRTESRVVTSAGGFQDFLSPSGGLIPDAIYHYRIVASNEAGTTYGDDVTFRVAVGSGVNDPTPTSSPTVSTGTVAGLQTSSAILLGTVNPNRGTTVVQFQFGPTISYGRVSTVQGIGNGSNPVDVSLPVTGLLPGTTYQYRLIASNSAGASLGTNASFTTPPAPPAAVTGSTEVLDTTSVRINGSARAGNAPASVFVEYGTDPFVLSNSTQTEPGLVAGSAPMPVSADLVNLKQGVTYFYRVRADGGSGAVGFGETKSFKVGLLSGLIQQFPDGVPLSERNGSLDVVINPALPSGGWRFLGEKPWRASGVPATGLTSGDRVIEFRPVAGFVQPSNETIAISSNGIVSTITRSYAASGDTGSGSVNVILRPEGITEETRPFEDLAKWAVLGETDLSGEPLWRSSGTSRSGLLPGNHTIIAKSVTGRGTPQPITVRIHNAVTTNATITYYVAEDPIGTPPTVVDFQTVSDNADLPHAWVGQFRSDAGVGSGFVVRPGVVATAGHVLFDDGTLSSATNMQWLHRHDNQVHDPVPLIPRGYFLLTGYAAQRATDNSPGTSTPDSQNLDAASAFFLADPGKRGFSGFLASDTADNEFLLSSALKTLVGYPVDGIADANLNRMHATPPANISFARGFGRTFTTSDIRSSGGGSGGPLCVQYENGSYYPAAIYLGGTRQTVVRAIDSDVADLIGFAESSATVAAGNTGGSLTLSSETPNSKPLVGDLEVFIEPASARAAGAGWRIQAASPWLASGASLPDLAPNTYTVRFAEIPGFVPPAQQSVDIDAGFLRRITFTYEEIVLPPVIDSVQAVSVVRGQAFSYQISASNSPGGFSLRGALPSGLTFNEASGTIAGTPDEAGVFNVLMGASNSGGADSKPLSISCLPALADQTVIVPVNLPMSHAIVSSEGGDGVLYGSGPLPQGLSLAATTGVISGTPRQAGTFLVPIQVTRRGATAAALLRMDFTDTAPVITAEAGLNREVSYHGETTLEVTATGSPEPVYQWYVGINGDTTFPVAGAVSSVFTTGPLTAETRFWVRVSNNSGFVDSSTFTVGVRPSTNANLRDLIPGAGALVPAFNAGITSYTIAVPNEVLSLTLTPIAEIGQSSVTINGVHAPLDVASDPLDLAVGSNSVAVRVTAGDGVTSKTYNISVLRGVPPEVATDAATDLTENSVILRGLATPNGSARVFFQYGTTGSYGSTTPDQEVSGSAELDIQAPLTGLQPETAYHFRIGITTGAGTVFGDDFSFETSAASPTVATGDATDVETTKVKLIGAVESNGNSTTVYFQWGETILYGFTTPSQVVPPGTNVTDIQFTAEGLVPGTTYNYRLVAVSPNGTSYGDNVTFIAGQANGGTGVPAEAPVVTTGGATDISTGSANLTGSANPKGGTTFVRFDYGLTGAYGGSTASKGIGNGTDPAGVLINVTGLLPGQTYHYRLVASNSLGSVFGGDATFTTPFLPPLATTGSASPLGPTSARVSGTVRPRGADADVFVEYGTDGVTFPNRIRATPGTVGGDLETAVSVDLTNLEQRVTYHYRVVAERSGNPGSSTAGQVRTLEADALYGLVQKFTREVPVASRESVLTVNLTPTGIGAWRFVGETDWRLSGVAVGGLTSGDRLVEYLPAAGYIQPPREQVGIVNGETPQVLQRSYYRTTEAGSAGLRVVLGPDTISAPSVPPGSRAQWRLAGESAWRDSNALVAGLPSGAYVIEFKAVPGRNTPPGAGAELVNGQTSVIAISYPPANAPLLNPPAVLPFATTSSSRSFPYAYVGQFRTDAGSQTGFAVKPRVVATTSLAVFNDTTLTRNTGMQWLLQRDKGTYEPTPLVPRGTYVFTGYEAQRISEGTPGTLSLASQNLNVAALYFAEDAGRGGFSGYLSSDRQANEFLQSSALKTMAGYPVNGVADAFEGRMHATAPSAGSFGHELGRTYSSSAIRGLGGMEGGPLCVQFQQGSYYPAGIYLGGTTKGIVRAIDGPVVDMFNRAELSGNGGDNNTGGGITHSSFTSLGTTTAAALKVTLEPAAARNALAGWRLDPETSYRLSGSQKTGLSGGKYTLELKSVPGFEPPTTQSITLTSGQLREITFTYQEANVAPTLGNVGNVVVNEDSVAGPLAATLFDADDAATSLILTGSSSNTTLVPNGNIAIAGSGASRTVTVAPAANQTGTATIMLTVSDGKLTATDTFTVTVNAVNDPPTITSVPNQTLAVNTSTAAIPVTIGDVETAAASLVLTGASSNTDLIPNSGILPGGSGANRNVTVTPLAGRLGSATITLSVSDGSTTTSRTFTVTVTGSALETWRFTNFGSANNIGDAADDADPDGDGRSNLDEYTAGTDPRQASDCFRVSAAVRTGTVFSATAPGKAGRSYALQRRPDLDSGPWIRVAGTGPLASDGPVTLTDPGASASRGFYRLIVEFSPP